VVACCPSRDDGRGEIVCPLGSAVHLNGKAAAKIIPPCSQTPCWKGLGADSEEKHEPASDIETAVVDSLKALDPERPIREADIGERGHGLDR
jgi:hypothetical protein